MAKTTRTIQEINNEYFQTAAMLGDLDWKVTKFEGRDLGTGQMGDLRRKLRTIDNEMDEYQKEKAKEDKKNAETAKTTGVPGMNGKATTTETTQAQA